MAARGCPAGESYWTCALNSTVQNVFAGCCSSNPCHSNGICLSADSSAASTSRNSRTAGSTLSTTTTGSPTSAPTTTPTASPTTSIINNYVTRNPSEWIAKSTAEPKPSGAAPNTAATVGGAVGGVLLIFALGAGWYLWRLRRREKQSDETQLRPLNQPPSPAPSSFYTLKQPPSPAPSSYYTPSSYKNTPLSPMSMTDAGGMYSPALFSAGFGSMRKDRREFSAELPVKPQEEPTFYAELSTVMLEPVEMGGDDVQPFLPFGSNMDGGAYDRYTSTDHSSAAWERRLRDSQEGRMGASRGVEGPSSAATWETEEEEEDIVNSRAWRRQHEGSDSEEEEERGRGRSANWEVHGSERGRMLH